MRAALLRIELRRSVALLALPLLLTVAWFIGRGLMPTGLLVWLDTSNAIRNSVLTLIPLVGGLSAWTAIRNHRRGTGEMLATTPLSPASRDLATWAGTTLWGIAAYTLYACVLLALTLPNATWGAPSTGLLLVGLLTLVAGSALGYAAGYYLPNWFVPPIVAVLLFGAQIMPENLMGYEMLSPVPSNLVYTDVFQKLPQATLPQSLWFGGMSCAALAAVALKTRRKSPAYWSVLAGSVVAATVGAVMLVDPTPPGYEASPDGYSYAPPPPEPAPFEPVCQAGEIDVCLHPAYASLLPEVAEEIARVAEPLVGLPGAPTRAMQTSSRASIPQASAASSEAVSFSLWSYEGDWSGTLAADVSRGLMQDEAEMNETFSDAELAAWNSSTGPTCESIYGEEIPYSRAQEAQGIVRN